MVWSYFVALNAFQYQYYGHFAYIRIHENSSAGLFCDLQWVISLLYSRCLFQTSRACTVLMITNINFIVPGFHYLHSVSKVVRRPSDIMRQLMTNFKKNVSFRHFFIYVFYNHVNVHIAVEIYTIYESWKHLNKKEKILNKRIQRSKKSDRNCKQIKKKLFRKLKKQM